MRQVTRPPLPPPSVAVARTLHLRASRPDRIRAARFVPSSEGTCERLARKEARKGKGKTHKREVYIISEKIHFAPRP